MRGATCSIDSTESPHLCDAATHFSVSCDTLFCDLLTHVLPQKIPPSLPSQVLGAYDVSHTGAVEGETARKLFTALAWELLHTAAVQASSCDVAWYACQHDKLVIKKADVLD